MYEERVSNIVLEGKLRTVLETQELDAGFKVECAQRAQFVPSVEDLRERG
jgi:hypothetical protein